MKARLFRVYVAIRCAMSKDFKAEVDHRMKAVADALQVERVRLKALQADAEQEKALLDTGPINARMVRTALERPEHKDDLAERARLRESVERIGVEEIEGDDAEELFRHLTAGRVRTGEREETFVLTDQMVDRRKEHRDDRVWSTAEREARLEGPWSQLTRID